MDYMAILNSFAALIFVIGLIILTSTLLRKYGDSGRVSRSSKDDRRLSVVDSVAIDGRRKMVLLRRDDVEHLVIISADGQIVVESGIEVSEENMKKNKVKVKNEVKGK